MLNLAKQHIDVGLFTNRTEQMLAFWQNDVGLPFEELLPLAPGQRQHRHAMNGSVLKLNSVRDPMRDSRHPAIGCCGSPERGSRRQRN